MAFYHTAIVARATPPDLVGLVLALRAAVAADVGVGVLNVTTYKLKKATAWTAGEITQAEALIAAAPVLTAPLAAQREIDAIQIATKAIVLALIDETNRLRAALTVLGAPNLPPVTAVQALTSIRAKAGSL